MNVRSQQLATLLLVVVMVVGSIGPAIAGGHAAGTETELSTVHSSQDELRVANEVTLVTGHTVTVLTDGDQKHYRVNGDVSAATISTKDGTYVIPQGVDVERFHPSLFNIDLLVEQGLADDDADEIPLIVNTTSTDEPGIDSTSRISAFDDVQTLDSIGGIATSMPKADAAGTYAELAAAEDVDSVYLDVTFTVLNDDVNDIVSATDARETHGVTGDGVTVAVIDTGIDDAHPDLQGKVVDKADFTGEGYGDDNGHGTHVAATIAGTGAASDGQYAGVAPDAELVSVKVLNQNGQGSASDIIAGIDYAAGTADVASISLGGPSFALREYDPMALAVNDAVSQGVPVVVAAGNAGEYGSIGSPGIAEHAITVGASNKYGSVAGFSSRGPTPVGYYTKPDLVAPGATVTSAASTQAGFSDDYTEMSGTSMAAPVVSGTVALALEQNPDWTPGRVKNALTTTADPLGEDVFAQGAGRINATRAVDPAIVVSPETADFGVHTNNTTVSRVVTVTNTGDASRTLNVDAAAESVFETDEATVTVNESQVSLTPGETRDLLVTAHTNTSAGVYSGTLSLDGDYHGIFGFTRAHEITVEKKALSNDGSTEFDLVALFATDSNTGTFHGTQTLGFLSDGSLTSYVIRDGEYSVISPGTSKAGEPVLVSETVDVNGTTTVTLNESTTVERSVDMSAVTDGETVTVHDTGIYSERGASNWLTWLSIAAVRPDTDTVRVSENPALAFVTHRTLAVGGDNPDAVFDAPEIYRLTRPVSSVSGDDTWVVSSSELAAQDVTYHRAGSERVDKIWLWTTYNGAHPLVSGGDTADRTSQTIYVSATNTAHALLAFGEHGDWSLTPVTERAFAAGDQVAVDVNKHPFVGDVFEWRMADGRYDVTAILQRGQGGQLFHTATGTGTVTVERNGTVVNEFETGAPWTEQSGELPTGSELTVTTDARNPDLPRSTRTVTSYTATYDPQVNNRPPRLESVDVTGLNEANTVLDGTVELQLGVDAAMDVNNVEVWFAEGTTETTPFEDAAGWQAATVDSNYQATYDRGGYTGPLHVAIRVEDANGNTVETTVFDATMAGNSPPNAQFDAVADAPLTAGDPASFDASSSSDNLGIDEYAWQFGDGTTANGNHVEHAYANPGIYTVKLAVTDLAGEADATKDQIAVFTDAEPGVLAATNLSPEPGETVMFDARDSITVDATTYKWDFTGDGVTDSETSVPTAEHAYADGGDQTAWVTAVTADGTTESAAVTVSVQGAEPDDGDEETADPPSSGGGGSGGGAPSGGSVSPTNNQNDDPVAPAVNVSETAFGAEVAVTNARAGEPVPVAVPATAGGDAVTVTDLDITPTADLDEFTLDIETAGGPLAGVPALDAADAVEYVEFRMSGADGDTDLDHVTVSFTMNENALDSTNPADVTLYRYHDGEWMALETEHVGDGQYEAASGGFSVFAVGVTHDDEMTTAPATTDDTTTASTPDSTTTTENADSPGFGVPAVLVAMLLAAVLAVRRRG